MSSVECMMPSAPATSWIHNLTDSTVPPFLQTERLASSVSEYAAPAGVTTMASVSHVTDRVVSLVNPGLVEVNVARSSTEHASCGTASTWYATLVLPSPLPPPVACPPLSW